MTLENDFDTSFVSTLSYREKQMQQSYRPIIGIHKWFARRPGTLFRALMLSEFDEEPLSKGFYQSHSFEDKIIADPFIGGGTPITEANRIGAGVVGSDINPMAYWIVRQSLAQLDLFSFKIRAQKVANAVESDLGHLFKTRCEHCGEDADVKYFLRTKQDECNECGEVNALFPGYKISSNERHPNYIWYCPTCEELAEIDQQPSEEHPIDCPHCDTSLPADGNAAGKSFDCRYCRESNRYRDRDEPMDDQIIAIEYHCSDCKSSHNGRFFKAPDKRDRELNKEASKRTEETQLEYVPDDQIPEGDETTRLHGWGYSKYSHLFTDRQLLTLNRLAEEIAATENDEVRQALATVFSDSLRYQNMLCRYDTWALKIQDIFSVHGFPAGLVRAENNVVGIPDVGSGSFRHFVAKYERAKNYCEKPTEAKFKDGKKDGDVSIAGERIGADFVDSPHDVAGGKAFLTAGDSRELDIEKNSLDGVFTDPPYFDNLQYSELMDFCYIWLKKLLPEVEEFNGNGGSTRKAEELTVNETQGRGLENFTKGLSEVFQRMADGLKSGAPLVFTYHHNDPDAYIPVIIGILDAGLNVTGTLVAPAEMSASLHISGTGSSTVDTIFVCRDEDSNSRETVAELAEAAQELQEGGVDPTDGDLECMVLGHFSQRVINILYDDWDSNACTSNKIERVRNEFNQILDHDSVDSMVSSICEECANQLEDGQAVHGGSD